MASISTNTDSKSTLGIIDKMMMLRGMFNTKYFLHSVRPMIYKKAGNDPEKVQEMVVGMLSSSRSEMKMLSTFFKAPEELKININGKDMIPFGTAAGMDKDGDALLALSNFFGFLEPGTIIVNQRQGNERPRVATDNANFDLYNAQGFPSKGLDYFLNNIREYKKRNGNAQVYVNICGMPLSEQNAVGLAMEEMTTLLKSLEPYADGFVWNCASPNTEALKMLRDPKIAEDTAKLIKEIAPNKLSLVKIWAYESEEKAAAIKFASSFVEGGGHGVVTTNTKMFPKEQIPTPNWGYKSAGRSGKFLKSYRLRSVKDMREALPEAIIFAAGGIFDGDDAYDTFKAGANVLEGYTPYAFYGIGLLKEIEDKVAKNLKVDGYKNLAQMQSDVKSGKVR